MDFNLIRTVKTACRIFLSTAYFDHSSLTNYWNKKLNLNETTRQPINDAVKLRQKHTSTDTDLNLDDLSALDKMSSWKTTRLTSRGLQNWKNYESDRSQ